VANSNKSGSGSITGVTGTSVAVTCDAGYSGSGNAVCGTNGSFSTVSCSVNSCSATQVANSNKKATGSITGTTGASVTVTCDAGFNGGGAVTCGTDGVFTTVACTSGSCVKTHVANSNYAEPGSIAGETFAVVAVTCDEGYSGSADAVCGASGLFSTVVCSANSCTPTQVAHSNMKALGAIAGTTGESRAVSCDAGYSGSGSAVCGTDGIFSTVTCTPNVCASTQVSHSNYAATGSISGSTGDVIEVVCDDGFSGSGKAVCGVNGLFSEVVCSGYPCGATSVENSDHSATASITGVTGDVVTVTCNEGYEGSGDAVCRHSGSFFYFENVPVCVGKPCTPTQVPHSNKASLGSISGVTDFMDTVTCDPGYNGGGATWCQADGTFSSVTCHVGGCKASEVAHSSHWDVGSLSGFTNDRVHVTCHEGYSGSGYATCLTDGSWSTVYCAPEPCSATQVAHSNYALMNSITGVTGSQINVTCDAGFSGGGIATCSSSGEFNTLTCSPNACESYSVSGSDHAQRDDISGVTGDVVVVNCLGGFSGSGATTCGTDGEWSPYISCTFVEGNPGAGNGNAGGSGQPDLVETIMYFSAAPVVSAQVTLSLTLLSLALVY